MNAIDVISTEHRALAAVLSGLVEFTDGVAAGRFAPDSRLLEAMPNSPHSVPRSGNTSSPNGSTCRPRRLKCCRSRVRC